MNQHHQDSMERAASYAIGSGGTAWGGFVAMSGELTTVFGMVTAFLGMCVVAWRLYRDIKNKPKRGQ